MHSHWADFSKRVRQCIFDTCKVTPINSKASMWIGGVHRKSPPLPDPCEHLKMAETFQRSIRYLPRDIERIVYPIPHCVYSCRVNNPWYVKIRYFVTHIMLYKQVFIVCFKIVPPRSWQPGESRLRLMLNLVLLNYLPGEADDAWTTIMTITMMKSMIVMVFFPGDLVIFHW